jgi:hypothetical protein
VSVSVLSRFGPNASTEHHSTAALTDVGAHAVPPKTGYTPDTHLIRRRETAARAQTLLTQHSARAGSPRHKLFFGAPAAHAAARSAVAPAALAAHAAHAAVRSAVAAAVAAAAAASDATPTPPGAARA